MDGGRGLWALPPFRTREISRARGHGAVREHVRVRGPLVGASSVAQLGESLAAVDLELTAEQRAAPAAAH
ncbi:hypothetical protein SAMN02787144_1001571 [Streptomyces atratus]|uniref:Uncharacterized protein n=1 Tax=Streptomyces atratus TaxID=1893 RepID=A0A1K1UHZ5_STRAR|nr:hypothetical protein SAMN02787144_1001571 [Streptomyces atratus]